MYNYNELQEITVVDRRYKKCVNLIIMNLTSLVNVVDKKSRPFFTTSTISMQKFIQTRGVTFLHH